MWKTILVTTVVVAGAVGLLFATGVVSLSRGGESDTPEAAADSEEPAAADELRSLGYVGATPIKAEDKDKVGVVAHVEGKTSDGLNLVIPCGWGKKARAVGLKKPLREVRLMDMEGEILHTWKHDYPGTGTRGWANARFGPGGDLYVINARTGLLRLDWNSNLKWGRKEFYHHDFDFMEDGTLVGLVEEMRTIEFEGDKVQILDNGFAFVTPDGELDRVMWFYDLIADEEVFTKRLRSKIKRVRTKAPDSKNLQVPDDAELGHKGAVAGFDVFHANTVEVLAADSEGRWKKGDLMTSFRFLDTIAVFDPKKGKLKWQWGRGVLDNQHDPTLLDNGHVLLFDNGRRRKRSRVLEMDPATGKTVWTWPQDRKDKIFTDIRGLVQPLENGNILVNISQPGRVVEINRTGEVLWDYWTTDISDNHRIPLRMHRLQGKDLELVKAKLADADSGDED